MTPEPFDLPFDEFLQNGSDLDIDPIFAKPFEALLADYCIEPAGVSKPSVFVPGIMLVEVRSGIIAMREQNAIGGYLGCDLALLPDWRGRGLGAEIVIARCTLDGQNPAAQLDTAAYSPAGQGAHWSAWRQVQDNPDLASAWIQKPALG
ncbi:hypothetical protein [Croceicoccus gelatinilyticus]|uniref:hypothetical protein n=1 Tax=Croceicoccus gelatinilyticus TaxID=2835536 RepID=UPI001BCF3F93|nr:hypothetical protein [Croceicoccus gelatinilyticus]MBS7671712.1 hypothetical protein [Croceicoccus gelatinilyticus]